ncbi:sister chromatid cohesion protein PDS5 homolog B-B isoform X2 [Halyomorpha halys]|uniref:sister chromatid cohesion protein PDS5 homolog B-B isoform X2 n=1 Tax=Halyomorpha halys TaxID=286706 RepID=UPI0006D4FBBD|nr:sister chromatid cohesion protein PDS5 homolog B-B isoform X2 [Halyomorpha halys]
MPHEIVYPQGCRPVTEDLGPDELIRRLKTLAHTLQAMGQDEGMYQQYIPLAIHLAEDHFLQYPSRDVQLLIACCIADVLRVYAPEAPYKDQDKVKTIFQFLIKQLSGLKDPKDPAFKRYFYLLENLAYVKSFNMCFELEDCQEIFCGLFSLMFKIVNDEHSGKVKSFMLDVLCPLITESDIVSNELLNIILMNVVEPAKSQRKNAYLLAKDLIVKTSDTLEPYIQGFFNHVLIMGKEEKGLMIYTKVYDLIYELNKICPSVLLSVLPQLEVKLKSSIEEERLGAVSLLARMFSEKDSTLAKSHPQLWRAFLGRFNDINLFIRMKCVQYSMHFLLNHPELRADITETLKMRQHDSEESVRYEVVMAIVSTAKRDFEVVSKSEDLLEFVKERTLDKKFKIRKEAMSGLAMIYKKHLNDADVPQATKKAVTWIKDKILHGYYMTSMEDRILVERLLNTSLVPFNLPPEERMKKLYHLLGTIDDNANKAFLELQRHQLFARKAVMEWLEIHRKPESPERTKEIMHKITHIAKFLPDQVKAQEFLLKFSQDMLADKSLLIGLDFIVKPDVSCKECMEVTGQLLKKLGQPVMTNLYYNTIKTLLERVSSVMIDYEALKVLIRYVEDCLNGGNLIEELGLHPNTAGERGLKMLMMLAYVFPSHFFHADIISHLVTLVKTEDPMVLSVLTFLGKYKPVFVHFPEVAEQYGLVSLCKDFIDRGSPKQAKHAIRCLYINFGKPGELQFSEILEKVRNNLNPESTNYLTAIVAFGHIAQNLPQRFPVHIKNIVSRKIVKELLVKNTKIESPLPLDESWCSEDKLPFETRCKVEGLKAMARWLVGLKDDKLAAQKTFRMLTAFIAKKGDLLQTGKLSKAEMAWLRLAAGCAMLRICEQKGVGDQYFADQFYTLSGLVNDEAPEVRERFLNKLHKGLSRGLPHKGLPLDFMGFYCLTAFEENRKLRTMVRQQMWTGVSKRRDYAKSLSVSNLCSVEKAMEELPRILPDYMLLFSIPVLTHCPQFTCARDPVQLAAMRACLWHVMEPLLSKNDFYCFGFYKEMIERAKNCRDAVSPDDEEINHRMWTLCDLAMVLLLQKTTNFDYKDLQADIRIPIMFFKRNPDPNYVNTRNFLPVEFQYTGQASTKKSAPLVTMTATRRLKNNKKNTTQGTTMQLHATDAKPVTASETKIKLPGMEFNNSDGESSEPDVKKLRYKEES